MESSGVSVKGESIKCGKGADFRSFDGYEGTKSFDLYGSLGCIEYRGSSRSDEVGSTGGSYCHIQR
jgi:hypothetical protein